MYLPPLQAINHADLYQTGDVSIDPSATIGIGVILQAAPNCRIAIGAGACLGMGTILNACEGTIEIEPGAVLGAGVLMVGQGKVGANASVGAVCTIFNASIEPMQVLAAGSVLGDIGAKVLPSSATSLNQHESKANAEMTEVPPARPQSSSQNQEQKPSSQPAQVPVEAPNDERSSLTTDEPAKIDSAAETETAETETAEMETDDRELANDPNSGSAQTPSPGNPIYGQVYISRMLGTIFPQGQSINRRNRNNQ